MAGDLPLRKDDQRPRGGAVADTTGSRMKAERPYDGELALTVDVEDWFHTDNVRCVIGRDAWDECELRVERNTLRILEILAAHNVLATFFVLGWVAEKCPYLVRAIAAAGHEVASHGYGHELVYRLDPGAFRRDVLRSKQYLEDLTGRSVRGYRAPSFSITEWAIPILQELGFDYDSSAVPSIMHDRYGRLEGVLPSAPIALLRDGFYEISVACLPLGKRGIPWGGGGYFRLVPYPLWLLGIRSITRSGRPYIFYIHPWEIDPGQPRLAGIGGTNSFRQRVNLHRCEERFAALAGTFNWRRLSDLVDARSASPTAVPCRSAAADSTSGKLTSNVDDVRENGWTGFR